MESGQTAMVGRAWRPRLNEYQTPVTEALAASYPETVLEELADLVRSVPFIRNLVSPGRRRARDMPRDGRGRIIVDFANPHALEGMDYFRPAAIHFEKYGCYTRLKVNGNPNSEYGRWAREELRRCWEGYVRESDGEWVPGYMYWYLNYCPIMRTEVREDGGGRAADRVEGFPRVWDGVYWRFHYLERARANGRHAIELARRGCGKSFGLAAIMSHNFVIGRNKVAHKRVMTILTAYQNEYLSGKDGTLSKFTPMIDFQATHTQFPRRRLVDTAQKMQWVMGYKDAETGVSKGSLNQVIGVSSKDDEAKLRGKRGDILIEEMGSFPKLLSIYNTIRYGVEEGDASFGFIYLVGTANEDSSDFESARQLLYSPRAYNIQEIENVYDKPGGPATFGFFFPAYVSRLGCMDADGNSDVVKALLQILMKREEARAATDPRTLLRVVAEMPVTPAEAMMKADRNMFPVSQLEERLRQIDGDAGFYDGVLSGELFLEGGRARFRPTGADPIRQFPHEDNKGMTGAVEIFELPQAGPDGRPHPGRYIAGLDPYDDDASHTTSLGSLFILDLWTDRIVCEYTGRPMFADDMYETVRKALLLYDARLNYENNKKGLFAYFQRMNSVYLLTETLDVLRDKNIVRESGYGNKAVGTNATLPVNNYARMRLRDWLLSPATVPSADGSGGTEQVPTLYTLRSRALIQELISWNGVGNFDRVSAMGMLMLLREDRLSKCGGQPRREEAPEAILSDPFFGRYERALGSGRWWG